MAESNRLERADWSATDRRALAAVAAQFFANGAIFASFAPRLPEIRDRVDVGVETFGLLLSLAAVAGLVGSALVSRAVDAAGTRRVLVTGGVLLSAALVGVGTATTVPLLLLALACMHIFDVMVDVAMNMQGTWLSGRRRAPVMNRLHGLWSLGTLVGGVIASRLAASGVDLRTHLVAAAIVLLGLLVFVGGGLLRTDEHDPGEPAVAPPPHGGWLSRARRIVTGGTSALLAIGIAAIVMEMAPYDWAAFRLADDLGTGPGLAATGFVAVTIGMTAGRLFGDHLQQRLGALTHRRASIGLVGVGLLLATTIPAVPVVLVGFALVGLGNASLLPTLYERASRWPGRAGAGLGALTGGLRVGMLTAPVIIGGLAGTSLQVGTALALVALPATVAFAVIDERTRR